MLLAVGGSIWVVLPHIEGKRAVALALAIIATVLFGLATAIQYRDFRDGFARFGPGLQWRVSRAERPKLFYAITGLAIALIPFFVLMLVMLWFLAIWGPR